MAKVTPQEFADNWGSGLQNNLGKMKRSIERMTENPMEKAADAVPKMVQNFNQAAQEGRIANAFRAVSFSDWKSRFINAGIPRVQQGITDGKTNVAKFASALLAYQDSYLAELNNMPTMNKADTRAKMLANFDRMSEFKYRK